MSKKVDEPVEEPQVEEDEGEESDEYDVEEEEEEETGGFEPDDEEDEEDANDAGLTQKGDSLTALLLGGEEPNQEVEEADEEEAEDEEYTPVPEVKGPATSALAVDPPGAISRKRSRNEQEDDEKEAEDLTGDYGEAEEDSEGVKKKARAAAEEV